MVMEMMMMAVAAVDAVRPEDDQDEGEAEADDEEDPYDPPGYLGHLPCTKSLVKPGFYPGPSLVKKPGYPGS